MPQVPPVRRASDAGGRAAVEHVPLGCRAIEVRVNELRQLFNAIDPSPFHQRDLDPRAEEFIVDWGRDLPREAPLALLVHLDRAPGPPDEAAQLRDAVHEFFRQKAEASRRRLRDLFRRGRISLAIGLGCVAFSVGLGDLIVGYYGGRLAEVLRESLLIGGWVAMWRPLQIFLYDWWPIRADERLFLRLSVMPVSIVYAPEASPDSWRADWPARPASPVAGGSVPR